MRLVPALVLSFALVAGTSVPALAELPSPVSEQPSLPVIAAAPDFTLHDVVDGKTVRLSEFRGRAVLLAFVFTSCPSVCPLISHQMSELQRALKRDGSFGPRAVLLSVTVDPATDTASVLRDYAARYAADFDGWRFLRDDEERLRPVLDAYREWTKPAPAGSVDHPARVYLIDPRGRIREIYSLSFFNEKQVYVDIRAILGEAATVHR
jgi:protein SCO1